ncbi:radical SAM protein [Clostridium rectalis]|uniref:radical SAM protein n=1 Tax=Clostridium rectalis TaxID=2040295 RepID=UPI000F6302A2|nr:radical SAM protein [Clostridium rectalis]
MDRYNIIENKNNREIVLLKSFPCFWGKCSFCDYIEDNSLNEDKINKLNYEILNKITGKYKRLEVINSGSCFELPKKTLEKIKSIIYEKNIKILFLESHWAYKDKLEEMKSYFGIPIIFKIGVETFDYNFRNKVLNKNATFKDYNDVLRYFQSVCIMIGIKGQTKEMIQNDMDIILNNFEYATINIFTENTTNIKRDENLIKWFKDSYKFLNHIDKIEVLYENTDFGVGD